MGPGLEGHIRASTWFRDAAWGQHEAFGYERARSGEAPTQPAACSTADTSTQALHVEVTRRPDGTNPQVYLHDLAIHFAGGDACDDLLLRVDRRVACPLPDTARLVTRTA